jgi:hypothetical protein
VAALSRPDANNCPDALSVLEEVNTKYGGDSTVAGIVQSGEAICQSLGAGTANGSYSDFNCEFGIIGLALIRESANFVLSQNKIFQEVKDGK